MPSPMVRRLPRVQLVQVIPWFPRKKVSEVLYVVCVIRAHNIQYPFAQFAGQPSYESPEKRLLGYCVLCARFARTQHTVRICPFCRAAILWYLKNRLLSSEGWLIFDSTERDRPGAVSLRIC
jgi:hypothetical protein